MVERTSLEDFDLDKTSDFDLASEEGQRNRARANILLGDAFVGWSEEGDRDVAFSAQGVRLSEIVFFFL